MLFRSYHTQYYGSGKVTQCDGVSVVAKTSSYASAKDGNPVEGDVTYYGRISEIVELNYSNVGHVVLFKCDWVKNINGVRQLDNFGITEVNFNHMCNALDQNFEPFILASQAKQVYYVQDPLDIEWHAFIEPTVRDYYSMESVLDQIGRAHV